MDFKEIGLNHIWEEFRTNGEFSPTIMMVVHGAYRYIYPMMDETNAKDVITCFGAMARSDNAYQCLIFVEGRFRRGTGEIEDIVQAHPKEAFRNCIVVLHFHLRPEPKRTEITCAEYRRNGKLLEIGEEAEKDSEGDGRGAWFWDGYHDPNWSMLKAKLG